MQSEEDLASLRRERCRQERTMCETDCGVEAGKGGEVGLEGDSEKVVSPSLWGPWRQPLKEGARKKLEHGIFGGPRA